MLFLLLLFKNNKKFLKIAIALLLLVFVYVVCFMVYILKNVVIEIASIDIVDGYIETRVSVCNDTPFDVYLNDLRLQLNVAELSGAIHKNRMFKGTRIAGDSTTRLKFKFHIVQEYEVNAVQGHVLVVLSKFYIKVPLKHEIGTA
ncbi:hypothetical protein THOM_1392 [Trachipleistophora hominis]|uniref:Uncharacterized protein n=1 Tax=Trachipleistophora hominis TaxID=72359 RepID=L7JWQ1_TRAHO|nr:hypothetical protein THOM_1392 [Trachipleistophora hominis]